MGLGATSLTTVMQMVANGYGVTLVPEVAIDVEVRDERVKLLRFAPPQPGRTIGLAWRRTSLRKVDFVALGQAVTETLGMDAKDPDGAPGTRFAHAAALGPVASGGPARPMAGGGADAPTAVPEIPSSAFQRMIEAMPERTATATP
jgi:LysR family hydrogen peroxide-inducible transcriptional activator